MEPVSNYALRLETELEFEDAVAKVTELLSGQGFGVLTEIDVTATMKKKLDVEFKPYRILGACNPPFAYRALSVDNTIGVLLPCNVVIWDDGDRRVVLAMNPMVMSQIIEHPNIAEVAEQVTGRLKEALSGLEQIG